MRFSKENEGAKMVDSNDTRYTYAVSVIRVTETNMLDQSRLERMIDARTADDAIRSLVEVNYGSATEVRSAWDYEQILYDEQKKVYDLLREIAPEPDAFNLFLWQNDYHNIKVLLKAEFSQQKILDSQISGFGVFTAQEMETIIRDRELERLPKIMQQAVNESIETFNKTSDPQVIDLICDQAAYGHMLDLAKQSKNSFVYDLVTIMIDLVNIKTFLRLRILNRKWKYISTVLLPGGKLETDFFAQIAELTVEQLLNREEEFAYVQLVKDGLRDYKNTGSLASFEKLCDNYIMAYIKQVEYNIAGIEPLIAYLLAKETELKNVRIIMVGKINQIEKNKIRERLRDVYV